MSADQLETDLARMISLLLYGNEDTVDPDTRILDDGMLSSINMIELVADIEDRFGTAIPADLLYGPEFSTPRAIAALVARLRGKEAQG